VGKSPQQPIILNGEKLIPISRAVKQARISLTSMEKYVSLGIVKQHNHDGFRYINHSSLKDLKRRVPVKSGNAKWVSPDGKKYYAITKAASMFQVSHSTMWRWAHSGQSLLGFSLDVVQLGVAKKRAFIAEDSLLALAQLHQERPGKKRRPSPRPSATSQIKLERSRQPARGRKTKRGGK